VLTTIFDLITADVERALSGISQDNGYINTLEVARANGFDDWPRPSTPNSRWARIVVAGFSPVDGAPLGKDEYRLHYWILCSGFEADGGITPDVVNNTIAADCIKALGIDKQRGTHPATGNKQAINTYVRFASSEEMEQRDFQTTTLAVDVHTRTAEGDPCSQ
jgi:hypothetical protein